MNNEEEIIKQIKVLIQYAKDHEHTEITATEVNALELLLDLYSNKKEEAIAIARANYDVGMLEERSQWYKKINEKIEDLQHNNNGDNYSLINVINIIKELIEKEE